MSTFLQQEGAPSLSTSPEAVVFLQNFCEKAMGSRYVNQDAFSPSVVMSEASSSTPIFFILFPGYSPSKEIEAYAREVNHTVENGKLTLISMGQVSFISLRPARLQNLPGQHLAVLSAISLCIARLNL